MCVSVCVCVCGCVCTCVCVCVYLCSCVFVICVQCGIHCICVCVCVLCFAVEMCTYTHMHVQYMHEVIGEVQCLVKRQVTDHRWQSFGVCAMYSHDC